MTNLTALLSRFTDSEITPDALLDDLIRCPLQRTYCLVADIDEAFGIHTPDSVASSWVTVSDILKSLETIDA